LGQEAIVKYIIPGLKLLAFEAEHMEHNYKVMLTSMIKDMEHAVAPPPALEKQPPKQQATGLGNQLGSIWGTSVSYLAAPLTATWNIANEATHSTPTKSTDNSQSRT